MTDQKLTRRALMAVTGASAGVLAFGSTSEASDGKTATRRTHELADVVIAAFRNLWGAETRMRPLTCGYLHYVYAAR